MADSKKFSIPKAAKTIKPISSLKDDKGKGKIPLTGTKNKGATTSPYGGKTVGSGKSTGFKSGGGKSRTV